MRNTPFDFGRLSCEDMDIARSIIGSLYYPPDLVIAPLGKEYIYRWHLIPRSPIANVYFHIQVASDPERPLHDHPWDNTSVILSGGYKEIIDTEPCRALNRVDGITDSQYVLTRKKGDVVHRPATWAHRIILPETIPYSMSLFTTGPKVHGWGFWDNGKFTRFEDATEIVNGVSRMNESMA